MQASTLRIITLLITIAAIAQDVASSSNVVFTPDGVTVSDLKPGTKLAWLALTRERVGHHSVLHTFRGFEIATPAGAIPIGRRGADRSRSLWLLASVDGEFATTSVPPGYSASSMPMEVVATVGATAVTIATPAVEMLYVRPRGGAWFLSAADGGTADSDSSKDTVITVSLQSLKPFQGNPHPPDAVAEGDLILMIDPFDNRMSVVKVYR